MEEESVVPPGVAVPGAAVAVDFVPTVLAAIESQGAAAIESQGAAATGTVTAIMPMDEATARKFVNNVTRYEATAAQRVRYNDYQMDGDATTGARVEPTFMSLVHRMIRESQKCSRAYGALLGCLVRLPQSDERVLEKIKEYQDQMLEFERCRWMLGNEHYTRHDFAESYSNACKQKPFRVTQKHAYDKLDDEINGGPAKRAKALTESRIGEGAGRQRQPAARMQRGQMVPAREWVAQGQYSPYADQQQQQQMPGWSPGGVPMTWGATTAVNNGPQQRVQGHQMQMANHQQFDQRTAQLQQQLQQLQQQRQQHQQEQGQQQHQQFLLNQAQQAADEDQEARDEAASSF